LETADKVVRTNGLTCLHNLIFGCIQLTVTDIVFNRTGEDKAVLSYSDAPDGKYEQKVPEDAGKWYVKATVPETDNYKEAASSS
jgi:hypothetical protein